MHSGLRGSFFLNFETELAFPDFEVGFVSFGVVLEVCGSALGSILGVLGTLEPPFGGLGVALGVHFGGLGVPLGAFGSQSSPRTASLS